MADSNARLNVLIALRSQIGAEAGAALEWVKKYGLAIAATASAMAVFAGKQSIAWGSAMSDMAYQSQLSNEAFQVLSLAALDTGVKMEGVSKSAIALRKNIQDAKEGNATMTASLARLNLTAAGLQALAPERQWELIAQRIAGATDRQAAFNAAADLFGAQNAPKLLEMLQRLGVEGYDKLAKSTENIRLSDEQLKTLDDASDKLGRIVEHLKYIAAKGTVGVVKAVEGELGFIANSFNADEIDQAKKMVEHWEQRGNQALAANWRARLAELSASELSDPAALQAEQLATRTARAGEAARAEAYAAAQLAQEQLEIAQAFEKSLKEGAAEEAKRFEAWRVSAMAKQEADAKAYLAKEKALALFEAERALALQIAAGEAAIVALATSSLIVRGERNRLITEELHKQNEAIRERIALLEAEQAINPEVARQQQIDGLRGRTVQNDSEINALQPRPVEFGATSGLVEYLDSIPDSAERAQQAVYGVAQSMEQGIGGALRGLIDGTMSWTEALQNIASSIVNEIINSFVRMAAQWITQQIVMAVFGKALQAAQMAALTPVASAYTMMWMPAATAASIATMGTAAATGSVAAKTAVAASVVGFATGGRVTGPGSDTSDSILANLSNGEYVLRAAAARQIGYDNLDAINSGRTPTGATPLASSGGAGGGGGGSVVVNHTYHAGVTRADLAALVPEIERRTIAAVHDRNQRNKI